MYRDFENLFKKIEREWEEAQTDPTAMADLFALLWMFQNTLMDFIENGKSHYRELGTGEYSSNFGKISVQPPKTQFVLSDNISGRELERELGSHFPMLFQNKTTPTPKFEEVFSQLPPEIKTIVMRALEQKTHKARVSFKQRGEK